MGERLILVYAFRNLNPWSDGSVGFSMAGHHGRGHGETVVHLMAARSREQKRVEEEEEKDKEERRKRPKINSL